MPEFDPVLVVSSLDGTNGFRLNGEAGVQSGFAVAGAGDVDNDGFADVVIGAPGSDIGGNSRGLAYIAFGAASHSASSGFAAEIAAGNAYRLLGETDGDNLGFSVDGAGDVNGDGFADVIIGARLGDLDAAGSLRGASYVVFGGTAKLEALDAADGNNNNLISLGNLTATTGFRFDGVAGGDYAGQSVAGAGDINGDGFTDLIIGALFADTNGTDNGASYLVFGGIANLNDLDNDDGAADGRIDLAQLSAGQGMRIDGASLFGSNVAGTSVSAAGDVNGDGFDDVIVGAPFANPNGTETRGAPPISSSAGPQRDFPPRSASMRQTASTARDSMASMSATRPAMRCARPAMSMAMGSTM